MNTVNASGSPAEVYDRQFVPALFAQWGPIVSQAARLDAGQKVLDVACGTGVLALAAAERVGREGQVVGLDPNEEMLDLARRQHDAIEWRSGVAENLPFEDQAFDAVISQFGYMFFSDPPRALREMMRVVRPGGHLAVAVCDALDHSPGYAVFAELLHRLFGAQVAEAFRAPFLSGDPDLLLAACAEAGIQGPRVTRHDGRVRFASIAALVSTERACAWTLGGMLDESEFDRLQEQAEESLQPFTQPGGEVDFLMPALILTATRP